MRKGPTPLATTTIHEAARVPGGVQRGASLTMKYFTPERWIRFQDPRDKQVFYSAFGEWEHALKSYRRKLRRILRESPNRLKRFAESECLHDAVVLAIWQGRSR